MPATLTAVDGGRGFLITGTGVLTAADILALKTGVEADPGAARGLAYWLVDLTGVGDLQMSSPDVRQIVDIDRRLARLLPGAVVAVVAPTDVAFGLARMWQIMAEGIGWPSAVFRTIPEAEAWIRGQRPADPSPA